MEDPNILGIAQMGAKLSSALDLHGETCREARSNNIPNLVSLINSTSATLLKVHKLSQEAPDVFTEVCINDINGLAATCRVLYEGTLVILVHREKHNEEDKTIGSMKQEQFEILLSSLAAKTYSNYRVWEWLRPRLRICEQELRQAKFELMLRFLLGRIAQFQMRTSARSPGDWENERSLRLPAENIAKRRIANHKECSEERERWTKNYEPPIVSLGENKTVVTDSSSVTIAPSPVQVNAVMDKSEITEKKVKPETNNLSPVIVKTSVQEKEDVSSIRSDTTFSADTPSQNWCQRLFSRNSQDEWKYEDIEAYTLNIKNGDKHVAKLPLEEGEIRPALRKLTTKHFWKSRPSLMEQYASLDHVLRQGVDEAISTAKREKSRDMTLVAMSARKIDSSAGINSRVCYTSEMSITLFLSLGAPYAPIYIIGLNKEKWTVPYTSCETVKMIRDLIPTLSRYAVVNPPGIANGGYTILTDDNVTVTPETWESIRRPGMVLRLQTPPFPQPCYPYPPPMPVGPPGGGYAYRPPPPPIHKRPTMADTYQEMNNLLKLSDCWMPDKETIRHGGIGNLLRLWTNAIDTDAQDCGDMSDWSCSGSDFYD
ncbi:hypothetical protein FPOA_09332 [Fusarium poae]|uniref:Ubiquitin-like domain-containing protein n=1 Tax=Fusarium poae TaxID=36050 RepID=A0A1B8AR74_FUSPO|nr:hypothetical protein FPOA_09332 [Fusarium poae]